MDGLLDRGSHQEEGSDVGGGERDWISSGSAFSTTSQKTPTSSGTKTPIPRLKVISFIGAHVNHTIPMRLENTGRAPHTLTAHAIGYPRDPLPAAMRRWQEPDGREEDRRPIPASWRFRRVVSIPRCTTFL